MIRLSPGGRPRTTGLLALACAGLLAVIYVELDEPPLSRTARSMPSGADAAVGGAAAGGARAGGLGFDMPPLAIYSEIAARPLFSPTRRPPPPEAAPEEPGGPAAGTDDLLLRGIAIAGDSRVALIERRATGELVRALEGQSVDGWRVATIAPGAVVLKGSGGDEHTLPVEKDSSPPAAAGRVRRHGPSPAAAAQGEEAGPERADPEAPRRR